MTTGGYNENLFFNLTKDEKEELSCSICCHILRNPFQCSNGHQFCHLCITTWTYTVNGSSCPLCRVDGLYKENVALQERIKKKVVHCEWGRCFWTGLLEHLETHLHTVYVERSKKDAYLDSIMHTDRPLKSQRSRDVENRIAKQNTALSQQIQKIELQCHGKFEKIYKRILESEWRKLKNAEHMRHRLLSRERNIRDEDFRMFSRIEDLELRKSKEIEENKRRVKSLELKKDQFRQTSLRKSLRQAKEIKEENILQKRRIEYIMKKREMEKEKNILKWKELERVKSDRSQVFQRKLERDSKEWKEQWERQVGRLKEIERKKNAEIKSIQDESKIKIIEKKESGEGKSQI